MSDIKEIIEFYTSSKEILNIGRKEERKYYSLGFNV